MQDRDRVQEAHEAIDRRARQREAAAAALLELTPEAIAAEKARQEALTGDEPASVEAVLEDPLEEQDSLHRDYPDLGWDGPAQDLQGKLSDALQPVLEAEDGPEILGIGRLVFQWILVNAEDDYQLGIQLQVDEQPPAGFEADITLEQLGKWAAGKGLQGNRVEHKQFVATLFDRAIAVGAAETANGLVYTLEQLMAGEPTRTAVGDADEPSEVWEQRTQEGGDEPST